MTAADGVARSYLQRRPMYVRRSITAAPPSILGSAAILRPLTSRSWTTQRPDDTAYGASYAAGERKGVLRVLGEIAACREAPGSGAAEDYYPAASSRL
jgi:hypothetical protein